jgi:hypothetical protein
MVNSPNIQNSTHQDLNEEQNIKTNSKNISPHYLSINHLTANISQNENFNNINI